MQLGNVLSIASHGMQVQSDRLSASAQRVASATAQPDPADRVDLGGGDGSSGAAAVSGYDRRGASTSSPQASAADSGDPAPDADNVDLASERVAQLTSLRAFQANVTVLRTADEMLGSLVTQRA